MENSVKAETIITNRQKELEAALASGELIELNIKPSFSIQDSFEKNGTTFPQFSYTPCFAYVDKNGKQFVEDIKPVNELHKLQRALFEFCYVNLSIKDINN